MLAKSIMNTKVITILPSTTIKNIAELLYTQSISAVPVVDKQNRLLGIVSEGDLIYRKEIGTEHRRSWWLSLFSGSEHLANDYIKSHAGTAKDIMTTKVISVTEDTSVQAIAELLERHRIKRVPVLRNDVIVGIVSRANLVQSLAVGLDKSLSTEESHSDLSIREALVNTLHDELGIRTTSLNIIVENSVVHLWGFVDGKQELKAIQVAAEYIDGVRAVDSRLKLFSSLPAYGI